MTKEDIIRMAREAGFDYSGAELSWESVICTEELERFATLVASAERERIKQANAPEIERINSHIKELEDAVMAEREACEALHDHEDVIAPIGNSSWGEAYQEGWGQGTAAYREAIRARGNHD